MKEGGKSLKILTACRVCRKNTESKNPKVVKTKKGRITLLSKCELGEMVTVKNKNLSRARSWWIIK